MTTYPIYENGKRHIAMKKTEIGNTLRSGIYDSMQTMVKKGDNIRRITEIECERLQGFPDNWTDCIPSGRRYEALGNAVTVNVVKEIGKRLLGMTA